MSRVRIDLGEGIVIDLNRPDDAPPLTKADLDAYRDIAKAAIKHHVGEVTLPPEKQP